MLKFKLEKNWPYLFVGVFLLSIIIYGTIKEIKYTYYFDNKFIEKSYTIGKITDFQEGAKTSPFFVYSYKVDSKDYLEKYYITGELRKRKNSELSKYVQKRFYVLFVAKDPSYSKLLIKKSLDDSTATMPVKELEEIPTVPNSI